MDSMEAFLSWEFAVATVFVAGVIQFIKMIFAAASPASLGKPWFRVFLILMNPAWGLITAIPEGHLKGATFGARAMVGVVAGFLSNYVYTLLLQRLFQRLGINPPSPDPAAPVPASERKTPHSRPVVPPPPEQGP